MLGTQIAFTVVSAIATLVIAYSTWSFHHWTRKQHQPDPVLTEQVVEIDAADDGKVLVQARLRFLNPGPIPIYTERIAIGIRAVDRIVHKAYSGEDRKINPGETKEFSVGHTWPRTDLLVDAEAVIDVMYAVGMRGGELLISGLRVPSANSLPEQGPGPYSSPLKLLSFPGRPTPARYPVLSFTYPTTAVGRLWYRILRRCRLTPSQRFNKWCKSSNARARRKRGKSAKT